MGGRNSVCVKHQKRVSFIHSRNACVSPGPQILCLDSRSSPLGGKLRRDKKTNNLYKLRLKASIVFEVSGVPGTLEFLSTALEGNVSFLVPLCSGLHTTLASMSSCQLS